MGETDSGAGLRGVFQYRDFAWFWTAALISNSANWLQNVVVPFLMLELTDSNGWVGLASFASLFPAFLLTPIAGVLSDRLPRRLILLTTQSVQGLVAVAYLVLFQTGELDRGWIILLQFVSGISAGFQVSTWQAFVPLLVPRQYLLTAVRLNSIQFTLARALGPLAAILLLGVFGTGFAFAANAVTFALVAAAVAVARPRQVPGVAASDPIREVFREGVRYVRGHASLRQAALTGFVISFLGQPLAFALAPGLSDQIYDRGDTGQRLLLLALGAGALLISVWILRRGDRILRSRQAVVGLAVYATGVFVVGLTPWFAVGMVGFFLNGMAHLSVAVATNTSLQLQVDDSIRGRVVSIYVLGVLGGLPMGALVGGLLADAVGLRPVIMTMGLLMALYTAWSIFRFDRLQAFDADRLPLPGS
ncbi:MAG: MFS transporter [Acidimicrobiales bacterium]